MIHPIVCPTSKAIPNLTGQLGFYSPVSRTYKEARDFCAKCGLTLPEPETQAEADALADFFDAESGLQFDNDRNMFEGVWLGAQRTAVDAP